ncbi:MAG: hypothetical protein RBS57_06895 [Desulforhabdus sp.]|jgi:hypothetical protein|nr:hypothetical protein [Desulforhabdus sp.]
MKWQEIIKPGGRGKVSPQNTQNPQIDLPNQYFEDFGDIGEGGSGFNPGSNAEPDRETEAVIPPLCRGCERLEILRLSRVMVAGCVQRLDEDPWLEVWKPLPSDLETCLLQKETIHRRRGN